jgi:hypothetical protein
MATSYKTVDTDIITLRQIYVRDRGNGFIPNQYVLISDGAGVANWNSISSIYPVPFNAASDSRGSTLFAQNIGNVLPFSTVGVQGLFDVIASPAASSILLSNSYPPVQVSLGGVPTVSRILAEIVPNSQTITYSTSQSTLKLLGVGDIQLSTVTDLRAVFISISSFTAAGYADLSGEARAWRGYTYSTNSTSAGYATFLSSIPFSSVYTDSGTGGSYAWDWSSGLGSNLPLSTVEPHPSYYSTGDLYFSTVSFNMAPFYRYIHPNSTTKMFLEVHPSYFFDRMYLGASSPRTLVKEFSSFVQYETNRGPQIIPTSVKGGRMTSQMSNAYTSNYFDATIQLELDTAAITSNVLRDGLSNARYTLYHRIAGGMANLVSDGYCGNLIGPRGGFSNAAPRYDNQTPVTNSVFLHVYNQQGAAPPAAGP